MDFTDEQLNHAQYHLIDLEHDEMAPLVLQGGMLQLANGENVAASLTQARFGDDDTEWRTVWLAGNRLIHGRAHRAESNWAATHDESPKQAAQVTTWARPLDQVVALELDDLTTTKTGHFSSSPRRWDARTARVAFRDGTTVSVPLFGPHQHHHLSDRIDALVQMLTERVWA